MRHTIICFGPYTSSEQILLFDSALNNSIVIHSNLQTYMTYNVDLISLQRLQHWDLTLVLLN